jgi:diguanylate cyclase (GGDEF)-like protein/PAS domain S-box-containing protein
MLAKNIIENANEGVVVTDVNGVITDVNEAYENITGYSRDEVVGESPSINKSGRHDRNFYQGMWNSIHDKGFWQGEIWDRRKNGEVYPKWLSINTVRDERGQPSHYVGIFSDITSKKATEEQLERLAYFDSLTNLPNRLLFRDRLSQEVAAARRHGNRVALFFIDLDRFKYVNDTLGHAAGDELLQIVAQRLRQCVRESDTVSRLGGDEFTVIIPDIEHADQVSGIAQKIIDDLGRSIPLRAQEVQIGASVGVAVFPDDGEDVEQLIRHADMALYKAKDEGRNNFQFFSAELQTHIADRIALEEDLRKGLERNEFLLHYQPKYNLATGAISGMETLVRWQHPVRGMVSPVEFIPLAEETGLIIPMSEFILREACRQTTDWIKASGMPLKVAVNLSARQFQQSDLVEVIKHTLDETGLSAELLELELTERMVMGDVDEAIRTMQALRELGLSLAIDDFGTGYSSLSYLKRFPINTLKIDQSFVRDLTIDSDDASIVQAIIAMGRQLDLHVVAEGVETEEQLEFLRQHGCGEIQGYLMSRPLPDGEFVKLLQQ